MAQQVPLDNIFPTHDQAVNALLCAILQHPDIQNSEIYYPVILGESTLADPIRITSARDFGGVELIEPGLTLAVYPFHDNYDQTSAQLSTRLSHKSVVYDDKYLGRPNSNSYAIKNTFNFVVQLFYQDASYNLPVEIAGDIVNLDSNYPNFYPLTISRADSFQYKDRNLPSNTRTLAQLLEERTPPLVPEDYVIPHNTKLNPPKFIHTTEQPITKESKLGSSNSLISITTLPGERILRSWMSLLTKVIRSLIYIRPFALRNPHITSVDYPTSNWIRESKNLIFHTSYCVVSYDLYEPFPEDTFLFPNINEINLTTETFQQEDSSTINLDLQGTVETDTLILPKTKPVVQNITKEIKVIEDGFNIDGGHF